MAKKRKKEVVAKATAEKDLAVKEHAATELINTKEVKALTS